MSAVEGTTYYLDLIECALAGAFSYHKELDDFLRRSGISEADLTEARRQAECQKSRYPRAPKIVVVNRLIQIIIQSPNNRDILEHIAQELCRAILPDATPEARQAICNLRYHSEIKEKADPETKKKSSLVLQQQEDQRERFADSFTSLTKYPDNPQQRGYELEKLLESFFEFEGLKPRGSFKVVGEQIDGSFAWNGRTYLVEAKWQQKKCAGVEFGAFLYKIAGKSVETRGVFISINGYSPAALESLSNKGELRFVCIDGAHLYRSMMAGQKFVDVLETAWRYASETGNAYLPLDAGFFSSGN